MYLSDPGWSPDVRKAIDDLIDSDPEGRYVVTDFDNTALIFDMEHQLLIWQIMKMAFAADPVLFGKQLRTDLSDDGRYEDWYADICSAYARLWETYGPFDGNAVPEERMEVIRQDPWWREFAVKLRAFFSMINPNEKKAMLWIIYLFQGMTPEQVYDLAYESHLHYSELPTERRQSSSVLEDTKLGIVQCHWISGMSMTKTVRELWKVLHEHGFAIWACSASGAYPVMAAVDAFGLHDMCQGIYGVNIKTDDKGRFIPEFDDRGSWFISTPDGWVKDTVPVGAVSKGKGKVDAIVKGLVPRFGCGPCAGFCDSTGDYNFVTEFSSMKLAVVYNRVLGLTDGGGLLATIAMYQKQLGYDLLSANGNGDTLYVLQGRDENGLRSLRPSPSSVKADSEEAVTLHPDCEELLRKIMEERPSVKEIAERYSIRDGTSGFLGSYDGYHSIRCLRPRAEKRVGRAAA